ncbi:MAG: hypothetical protein EBZ48_00505 [Proteobacteria bacterium]|nr:hypothetical protein [Pseudomonadota bacterium]
MIIKAGYILRAENKSRADLQLLVRKTAQFSQIRARYPFALFAPTALRRLTPCFGHASETLPPAAAYWRIFAI